MLDFQKDVSEMLVDSPAISVARQSNAWKTRTNRLQTQCVVGLVLWHVVRVSVLEIGGGW